MEINNSSYKWLKDKELFGVAPFSRLEPWYFLEDSKCFWTNEAWKDLTNLKYLVFARRQDCDEFACASFDSESNINRVFTIHGWTSRGFDVIQEFDGIFSWMHRVIDDVEAWSKSGG